MGCGIQFSASLDAADYLESILIWFPNPMSLFLWTEAALVSLVDDLRKERDIESVTLLITLDLSVWLSIPSTIIS